MTEHLAFKIFPVTSCDSAHSGKQTHHSDGLGVFYIYYPTSKCELNGENMCVYMSDQTKMCVCVCAHHVFSLTLLFSQICGVPLRCVSGRKLGAVLRSRRSVDAERLTGGHAG